MSAAPQGALPAPPAADAPAARLSVGVLLQQLRPRQWTKSLPVYAPLLFAKSVFREDAALKATLAAVAFCLLASGIYVFNDWVDRDRDKLHPEKCKRPIAAGLISGPVAAALLAVCWSGGAALAWLARPEVAAVAGGYVALQIVYSLLLKKMVILDVVVIAVGFVLRVVGGGVAIDVPLSNWLYLCTLLGALFLGLAKRRAELASLPPDALLHRATLSDYTLPMLDQMISVVAASSILAYGLYSVSRETIEHVGSDRLKFTVPCVIYGIFRYLYLIHGRGAGGSPERVLLSDAPTIISILLFVTIAGWALYL